MRVVALGPQLGALVVEMRMSSGLASVSPKAGAKGSWPPSFSSKRPPTEMPVTTVGLRSVLGTWK